MEGLGAIPLLLYVLTVCSCDLLLLRIICWKSGERLESSMFSKLTAVVGEALSDEFEGAQLE